MCIELNDRIKKKVEWRHARLQREDLINLASIIAAKKKREITQVCLSQPRPRGWHHHKHKGGERGHQNHASLLQLASQRGALYFFLPPPLPNQLGIQFATNLIWWCVACFCFNSLLPVGAHSPHKQSMLHTNACFWVVDLGVDSMHNFFTFSPLPSFVASIYLLIINGNAW
jgi:hypothetical protein